MSVDARDFFAVEGARDVRSVIFSLDSGVADLAGIGQNFIDSSQIVGHPHFSPQSGGHAIRCASLMAGSFYGTGPVGIAYGATVIHGDYRHLFPDSVVDVACQVRRQVGQIDVVAMPFSTAHRVDYRRSHAERLSRLTVDEDTGALCVAATGHDGPECLRFPATLSSIVAVGVCRRDLSVHPSNGTSHALRKPDIVVPDYAFTAETEKGKQSTMSGTSAAVSIVAGAAAVVADFIREDGGMATPGLLRAALLALTCRTPSGQNALGQGALDLKGKKLRIVSRGTQLPKDATLQIQFGGSGQSRLAVCFRKPLEFGLWADLGPKLQIRRSSGGAEMVELAQGDQLFDVDGVSIVEVKNLSADTTFNIATVGPISAEFAIKNADAHEYYLGISASHNAAACVIDDVSILSAIQLERLTRRKNDGGPSLETDDHIKYVLADARLQMAQVRSAGLNVQALAPGYVGLSQPLTSATFSTLDPLVSSATYVSHHLGHAIAAFVCSNFDSACVLVADGSGGVVVGQDDLLISGEGLGEYLQQSTTSREAIHVASVYHFTRDGFRLVSRVTSPSFNTRSGSASWGETYAAVSQFLFGDWLQGSGKLMGLAAYGNAERFSPSLLQRSKEHGLLEFTSNWKILMGARGPAPSKDIMAYADLAARIQVDLETALLDWAEQAVAQTGIERIAYSGGIALNSLANDRLARRFGESNFFVLPASNDAGVAIGAAAAAYFRAQGRFPALKASNDYYGHDYSAADYLEAIQAYSRFVSVAPYDVELVAAQLSTGSVVAWFDGPSEFGQRALGHRSILGSPFRDGMQDYLNREIKFREAFRPFAPVLPEPFCERYFEGASQSPHMMRVLKVRDDMRDTFPSMCHVDGTARVQTLARQVNPRLYALLEAFGVHSGHPVLINTSLNVKGQPIVETPLEAIEFFLTSKVDLLVLGDYCLRRVSLAPDDFTSDVVLALAPDVTVTITASKQGTPSAVVESSARQQRYQIDVRLASALQWFDGKASIAEVERRVAMPYALLESPILRALYQERFFLTARLERQPKDAGSLPSRLLSLSEVEVLVPGTFRTSRTEAMLSKAQEVLRSVGVTRVSEITHFDQIGIPVFQAWRPDVHSSQITATQGKGVDTETARLSAMMEAIERHAGNQIREVFTDDELRRRRKDRAIVLPSLLSGGSEEESAGHWCQGINLVTGDEVYVPAAAVFFPFLPGAMPKPTPTPCTTGLAAGSSVAESVLHGLFEVVERHSTSIVELQRRSRLVDPAIVRELEPELVQKITDAGYEILVTDCSVIDGLPSFFVRLMPPYYAPPHLIASGQGCSLNGRDALRRALLEACQSRVVALVGNREDLIRHSTEWTQAHEEVRAVATATAASAADNGLTATVSEAAFATISEALHKAIDALASAGYRDIIYVDLTVPTVGIPVTRCIIPGMRDVISGR